MIAVNENRVFSRFNLLVSRMNSLRELLGNLSLGKQLLMPRNQLPMKSFERFYKYQKHDIPTPKPGGGKQFRRYVVVADFRLCTNIFN